jgi:hypothetical protein
LKHSDILVSMELEPALNNVWHIFYDFCKITMSYKYSLQGIAGGRVKSGFALLDNYRNDVAVFSFVGHFVNSTHGLRANYRYALLVTDSKGERLNTAARRSSD